MPKNTVRLGYFEVIFYLFSIFFSIKSSLWVDAVVSVPPHAVRTYIVSRDTVINMFYPTWSVLTEDRTFGDEDRGLQEEHQDQRRENQRNPRLRPRIT